MNYRKNYFDLIKTIINASICCQLIVKIISEDCPKDKPILLEKRSCVSLNCSEYEFETNYCIINNTIIKTQWLTNIIVFGDLNFRYINFVTYSNGDMVVESTSCPGGPKRMFYGLKKNGRNFFKENTPFYSITAQGQDNSGKKYESEILIIKLNDGDEKDKEYIISMTKSDSYVELYDFDHDKIYQKKMSNILGTTHENLRQAALTIISSDNKYYSIYGFINGVDLYLYRFFFSSVNDLVEEGLIKEQTKINNVKGCSVSCFETEQKIIICFYTSNDNKKVILAIDINFNLKGKMDISPKDSTFEESSFIKCIHLTREIGVFSFYDKVDNINGLYPFLYFKTFIDNGSSSGQFENSISIMNQEYIVLDNYTFTNNALMNDLTKISNSKICFTSTDDDHGTLFIIVLDIINLEGIKIRYYSFKIYDLLYYKFLQDMKSYLYNQFVVIGASVCRQKDCTDDHNHPHFSSLIFFSYPNSTDEDFEVSKYLFNNNDIAIESLEIDLKNYIKIENNIFGYIFNGIQIFNISNYNIIKLYSSKDDSIINDNYILTKDETIIIKFENNNYHIDNCSFFYYYIITEPEREIYDSYPSHIVLNFGDDNEEYFNSQKNEYIGRTSYFNIYLKDNLDTECNKNCKLCLKDKPDFCITCNNNYYFELNNDGTKTKICNQTELDNESSSIPSSYIESSEEESCSSDEKSSSTVQEQEEKEESQNESDEVGEKEDEIESEKEIEKSSESKKESESEKEYEKDKEKDSKTENIVNKKNCTVEGIIDNLCRNEEINNEITQKIYNRLKQDCLNYECAKQNKIVEIKNILFQMSTLENQKNDTYSKASNLDLGECENKLREEYKMEDKDEIIIFKRDIKNEHTMYVEYELYNSRNLEPLNLDICNSNDINIYVPVNLEEETESLYNSLYQYGYNLFNPNDSFYNDICTPYTTNNGTDMLLEDRKEDIYKKNGNITLCQTGCEFASYNLENKKAKCNCSIQQYNAINNKSINIFEKFDEKKFADNFLKTLKKSNFRVLKCYKLVITFNDILKNIGRLFMTIILLIIIILIIICQFYEKKKINKFIQDVLIFKKNNTKDEKKDKRNKLLNLKKSKTLIQKEKKRKKSIKNPPLKSKNDKHKTSRRLNYSKTLKKSSKIFKIDKGKEIINSSKSKINGQKSIFNNPKKLIKKNTISIFKSKDIISYEYKIYNDRELNSVTYENALKYDKRSYFQYYISLLLQKHLILFTFFAKNDYNLYTLKIILFLLSFCLYFSINGFFFTDDTMHKIYKDNGVFNLLNNLPQILYSSVASAIITIILKQLSLSEKDILDIKQEKKYNDAFDKSKKILSCLFNKFILFYILSLLFMIFFWYFISCFCAVFSNNQIILIKDTIISFGISMVYPFGLNLLPGIFRISALRTINEDKKCLYKFSLLVALI